MSDLHEISRPAGPRPAGLSNGLSGASFGGVPKSPAPAQTEPINPRPLDPPYPGMSQGGFQNSPYYTLFKRPWAVQRSTSAPGQAEGGKRRKKKMTESLVSFIMERKKKRTEGGWPGEKPYSGPFEKELPPPAAADKPKAPAAADDEPKFPGEDMLGKSPKEVLKQYGDVMPEYTKKWGQAPRYPTNPPHPPPKGGGMTRGTYRESSSLIDAVLVLQEMQGGNLFEKAKKKVIQELLVPSCEGVGYSKETTTSERGIGPTASLTYEGGRKLKRAEGGLGGHLSQMGSGEPGETKNYGGPASSLGGNLNKILGGGGKAPGPSTTDKDLGGDAGAAAGTAAGATGGASGGGEGGGAAAASGAAQGATGGGKEGSTSPVSGGLSPSSTTVQGGPGNPPASQPSPTKTEGGKKKSGHSRR